MDFPKTGNGFPQTGKPIPDINTYLKPNNKQNTAASAASIRQKLDTLDYSFIFDHEFYKAAADFLNNQSLDEKYIDWLYGTLKNQPDIKNLRGYFYRVFCEQVYADRYFSETKKVELDKPQETKYCCPICGQNQIITAFSSSCMSCDMPLHPDKTKIMLYKTLYKMDPPTKEAYRTACSQALRQGGNLQDNLHKVDLRFGVVR